MESNAVIPDEYWEKKRTCLKDCEKAVDITSGEKYELRIETCPVSTDRYITKHGFNGSQCCFKPKQENIDLSNQEHYTKGSIQPWDYIIANDLDFLEGNVVKYITRHKYKGTQKADLEKIKVCVDKIIEGLES